MATSQQCERCEVFFSGRVQGVGFRYITSSIAGDFEVVGFVRNLPDGRVQLVCEAAPEVTRDFLQAIRTRMGGNIIDTATDHRPATGEFDSFNIAM